MVAASVCGSVVASLMMPHLRSKALVDDHFEAGVLIGFEICLRGGGSDDVLSVVTAFKRRDFAAVSNILDRVKANNRGFHPNP